MTESSNPTTEEQTLTKPTSKSRNRRDFYIKIIVEVFSVVFAVLLALGVDEWKDNKKKEDLAHQVEINIKDEIKLNIERLREMLAENELRIKKVDSLITTYQAQPKLKEIDLPGMTFTLISAAAWQSAKSTVAINYIKFDNVLFYSSFYDLFAIYRKKLDGFMYSKDIRIEKWNSKDAVMELRRMKKIYEEVSSTAKQIEAFYISNKDNLNE